MQTDYESEPPATCYHCHERPPVEGSVFCGVCQPDRTGYQARILHERFKPRRGLFAALRRTLAWITCPWVRVLELEVQLKKTQAESADFEQSNLALRKKCADLRAQRDGTQEAFDALHVEHEMALAAHRKVAAERDTLEKNRRSFTCGYCGERLGYSSCLNPPKEELAALVEVFKEHDGKCDSNPLVKRIRDLEEFARFMRDGFDHREDAHRHNNLPACPVCCAENIIGKKE
jgi:hypothetical protein